MQTFSQFDIWSFQSRLTRRLLAWAAPSILLGALLLTGADPFLRGVGVQFVAWGAIDAVIALLGARATRRRAALPDADPGREVRNLRRLLWINTALDVLYVAGGWLLWQTLGRADPFWAGNGFGILVQGGFLFFFDLYHALRLRGR